MAVTRDLKPTVKLMKRDSRYKRLKESFDSLPAFQVPVAKLADEVETLHNLREIRRLNTEDPGFVDHLIKANTNDQSVRGRLTAIMMTCVRSSMELEKAVKTLRHHLLVTFTEELKSFRTKEERVQVVDMALTPFTKYLSSLDMLKESAQLVVIDIDKGNWSLRTTIEALKLHTARERNI